MSYLIKSLLYLFVLFGKPLQYNQFNSTPSTLSICSHISAPPHSLVHFLLYSSSPPLLFITSPSSTPSAMDAAKERAEEEVFFRSTRVPPDVIRQTRYALLPDQNAIFAFETPTQKYAVLIVLRNHTRLGWRECQALVDSMLIAARGTKLSIPQFQRLVDKLHNKYGKTAGPAMQADRLVAVVYPGPGDTPLNSIHSIAYTGLHFDRDGDPVIRGTTVRGITYNVCIQLASSSGRMHNLDCKAFMDAVVMLETGDMLPPNLFFAKGAAMRKKYNFVVPTARDERRVFTLSIFASRFNNADPLDPLFTDALRDYGRTDSGAINHSTIFPSGVVMTNGGEQLVTSVNVVAQSPYPGIVYTRALKESGQAQVYEGLRGEDRVAVKVFLDQESESARDVYKIELRMLLKMSRHENVVEVLDFFETPKPALLMRYIEGEDLMDFIKERGRFEESGGRTMCKGIAKGLCHLHKNGVVHRDFKSLNILRRRDGVPVIIDLGMGSLLKQRGKGGRDERMTIQELCRTLAGPSVSARTSTLKGTVLWMAPEMITKQMWSDKTDVYAFGIIMWEIFSGQVPFQEHGTEDRSLIKLMMDIVRGDRPSMEFVSHVSEDLKQLMQACWHVDPKARPSMRRVLDCLNGNDPRELFASIDTDGNLTLDFGEFVNFLQRYAPGTVRPGEMHLLFAAIDCNGDGTISVREFEEFWRQVEMTGLEAAVASVSTSDLGRFIENL